MSDAEADAAAEADAPSPDAAASSGRADEALAAILDQLALPPEAERDLVTLEREAWQDYRAGRFHRSSDAFAVLTKLDGAAWKHPYNAACAASRRADYGRAQVFLAEALRRDHAATQAKASKDSDLGTLRRQPWFAELIEADAVALDAWTIRELPALERRVFEPGQAPLAFRDIEITPMPPVNLRYKSNSLRVSFEAEKLRETGPVDLFTMTTVCADQGRYRYAENYLRAGDKELRRGRSEHFDLLPFHSQSWPEARVLDHCELEFLALQNDGEARELWSLARYCWVEGQVSEGPCADFERRESSAVELLDIDAKFEPRLTGTSFSLDIFALVELGTRPDVGFDLELEVDCGDGPTRQGVISVGMVFPRSGEAVELQGIVTLDAEPEQCTIDVVRARGGPRDIATIEPQCYAEGRVRPGAC